MKLQIKAAIAVALVLCGSPQAFAQPQSEASAKELEDLMKIEVTSVSKKEEQLFRAPSAVYVLTRADIRRSGATSIPEVLRLVPGLAVAQIDSGQWAVTARGFNGLRANKLLVLIDGRSVYTPVFSGVYWDSQLLPLEDIERIEVIRGPGATVWGANAVNGVINVISRETSDTVGGSGAAGGGSLEQGFGSFRYGGALGVRSYYRVYGTYFKRGQTDVVDSSQKAGDDWQLFQGGLRADLKLTPIDTLTLSANKSRASIGQRSMLPIAVNATIESTEPTEAKTGSVVASWSHRRSSRSSTMLTLSYSDSMRTAQKLNEDYDTLDVDFQQRFSVAGRHDFVWGVGHRLAADREDNTFAVSFTPDHSRASLVNMFVQDGIALAHRVNLTLGTKIERHTVSGVNVQPNARLAWSLTDTQTFWTAVSRAVRTPARSDLNIRVNQATFLNGAGAPVVLSLVGNPAFKSERVLAYEAGYRVQLPVHVQVDTAGFYNVYQGVRHVAPFTFADDLGPPHIVVGTRFDNHGRAFTSGVETIARWSVRPSWTVDAGYTWFTTDFGANEADQQQANSPTHQGRLASGHDLPWALRLDVNLFLVGATANLAVPAYVRTDVRLAHQLSMALSLELIGQNVLDARHREFVTGEGTTARDIPRSVYARLLWQF